MCYLCNETGGGGGGRGRTGSLTTASPGPSLLFPERENWEVLCTAERELGLLLCKSSQFTGGGLGGPQMAISSEWVCRFWPVVTADLGIQRMYHRQVAVSLKKCHAGQSKSTNLTLERLVPLVLFSSTVITPLARLHLLTWNVQVGGSLQLIYSGGISFFLNQYWSWTT